MNKLFEVLKSLAQLWIKMGRPQSKRWERKSAKRTFLYMCNEFDFRPNFLAKMLETFSWLSFFCDLIVFQDLLLTFFFFLWYSTQVFAILRVVRNFQEGRSFSLVQPWFGIIITPNLLHWSNMKLTFIIIVHWQKRLIRNDQLFLRFYRPTRPWSHLERGPEIWCFGWTSLPNGLRLPIPRPYSGCPLSRFPPVFSQLYSRPLLELTP